MLTHDTLQLIIERVKGEKRLRELPKKQYVLPARATVAQLQHVIRQRACEGGMSIYLLVKDELPAADCTVGELAQKHRDPDGFLYVKYSSEDTMG